MVVKDEELVQIVIYLHKLNRFEDIIKHLNRVFSRGKPEDLRILHGILWPIPSQIDFEILSKFIKSREIQTIYSIGCGTGLLEWLLTKYLVKEFSQVSDQKHKIEKVKFDLEYSDETEDSGLESRESSPGDENDNNGQHVNLIGVEVDKKWWTSSYAPPIFLDELHFLGVDFPQDEPFGDDGDMIIFSYFNNMPECVNYLKRFRGQYVVIIGPVRLQYCAPMPLDLSRNSEMPIKDWTLILFQRFGLEEVNFIGIYSRAEDYSIITSEPEHIPEIKDIDKNYSNPEIEEFMSDLEETENDQQQNNNMKVDIEISIQTEQTVLENLSCQLDIKNDKIIEVSA